MRKRVSGLLRNAGVGLEVVDPAVDPLKQSPDAAGADLLVVRRSRVRPEDLSLVSGYTSGEGAPRVVVLRDDEADHSGDRARLLAAGASVVLEGSDSNEDLRAGLEAAVAADGTSPGRGESEARLSDFLSRSPAMQRFLGVVQRVVDSDSSLLITGETGVGKERLARAIHNEGPRQTGPFVSVNCGALPEPLLESELFGHEIGAFTGANRRKKGRFEMADGGTIFLDEIAEMPVHLQVHLLTVLQRQVVQRLGGEEPLRVDIRVIAATNRKIEEHLEQGRFREDLYYRLNVVNLQIPPLRERPEDVPNLAGTYIRHLRTALRRERVETISDAAIEAMQRYSWPGNVRELVNAVEHAVVMCEGSQISLIDLPAPTNGLSTDVNPSLSASESFTAPAAWDGLPLRTAKQRAVDRFERDYLVGALRHARGKVGETARLAGMTPRALYDKMKHHGLRKEDFRWDFR